MRAIRCSVLALSTTIAILATAGSAIAATPPKAKISPKQAEVAATKRIPGKVLATKYEFEDGHWQYAVTIATPKGAMYEAEVSARTGKITDTEKTSAAEEAAEAAADKKSNGN